MALLGVTLLTPQTKAPVKLEVTDVAIAKQHYETGVSYFERGEFRKAVVEFEKAYDLIKDPRLQYNIGECYAHSENFDKALEAFQIYMKGVMKNDPAEKERWGSADVAVAQIRMDRARFQKEATPPPAPAPTRAKLSEPAVALKVQTSTKTSGKKKVAGYSLAVVGGLALGGSVWSYLRALKYNKRHAERINELVEQDQVQGEPGNYRFATEAAKLRFKPELDDLEDGMNKSQTISIVALAGGLVLAGTGVVLLVLDHKGNAKVSVDVSGTSEAKLQLQYQF